MSDINLIHIVQMLHQNYFKIIKSINVMKITYIYET